MKGSRQSWASLTVGKTPNQQIITSTKECEDALNFVFIQPGCFMAGRCEHELIQAVT